VAIGKQAEVTDAQKTRVKTLAVEFFGHIVQELDKPTS
jgi:hypothetical protein